MAVGKPSVLYIRGEAIKERETSCAESNGASEGTACGALTRAV